MVIAWLAALAAAASIAMPGHGPYPVVMEVPASLPSHTIYRPRDLTAIDPARPLPVLAWANGGCRNAGNADAALLAEIASHGYLVIAIGPIDPQLSAPRPAAAAPPTPASLAAMVEQSRHRPPPTTTIQLSDAVDWAERASRSGPLRGRIDPSRVAFAGHSCGGLQAVAGSARDARVKTTVLLNSGIFDQPTVPVDKTALDRLRGPIAYFIGGSDDISHVNAEDDFARITRVPALKVVNGFGHSGKLNEPYGGPTAAWVVEWLDWQLKGEAAAAKQFVGKDCGICTRPELAVERKGI